MAENEAEAKHTAIAINEEKKEQGPLISLFPKFRLEFPLFKQQKINDVVAVETRPGGGVVEEEERKTQKPDLVRFPNSQRQNFPSPLKLEVEESAQGMSPRNVWQGSNENVLSKVALAQRARQERERNEFGLTKKTWKGVDIRDQATDENVVSKDGLAQRAWRERERNEIENTLFFFDWEIGKTIEKWEGVVVRDTITTAYDQATNEMGKGVDIRDQVIDENVVSKAALAQRARREHERNEIGKTIKKGEGVLVQDTITTTHDQETIDNVVSKAVLAQRVRREREKNERKRDSSGECIQPSQPRLFPGLTPRRRQQRSMKRDFNNSDVNQSSYVSNAISQNAPKRSMG